MEHFTREPVNVPDALARDRLVRRFAKIRADAVIDKNTIEHWNRMHPDEEPLDAAFEDSVIAWCDGKGPLPTLPPGDRIG
jgi:acyl carrier protein phosphodiesterase